MMPSRPASAIPPPDLKQPIRANQVWVHLSVTQQQQVRQTLIMIAQASLQPLNSARTPEELSDEQPLHDS